MIRVRRGVTATLRVLTGASWSSVRIVGMILTIGLLVAALPPLLVLMLGWTLGLSNAVELSLLAGVGWIAFAVNRVMDAGS